jgi:hypothetical protein
VPTQSGLMLGLGQSDDEVLVRSSYHADRQDLAAGV